MLGSMRPGAALRGVSPAAAGRQARQARHRASLLPTGRGGGDYQALHVAGRAPVPRCPSLCTLCDTVNKELLLSQLAVVDMMSHQLSECFRCALLSTVWSRQRD